MMIKREGLADYLRNGHPHKAGIIVSESKKMIYMKPTKTAGTTVLWHFLAKRISDIFHLDENPTRFNKWLKELTDDVLGEYYIFTVVRNPFDRIVSSSAYLKIPFASLVHEFDNHIKDDVIFRHTLPQHYYSHFEGKRYVDYICRFETLGADMNLVCDNIGLERVVLPRTNRSNHKDYTAYYGDEKDILRVQEIYSLDISYYGYTFQKYKEDNDKFIGRIRRKLNL